MNVGGREDAAAAVSATTAGLEDERIILSEVPKGKIVGCTGDERLDLSPCIQESPERQRLQQGRPPIICAVGSAHKRT